MGEFENISMCYTFIGIASKKKRDLITSILSYCKEIRDTAYPMTDSNVTQCQIVEFTARKEKDMYSVNGTLVLVDGERKETRDFEAYIIENEAEIHVYMDIIRVNANDEPKMIRTSECFIEDNKNIISVTNYCSNDTLEQKNYSAEFPKNLETEECFSVRTKQLSAL